MPDIPGNSTTTATIAVGGSASDQLEIIGDHDWFAIQLVAGQKITIYLDGLTLEDAYLRVRDAGGALLAENDDISSGTVRDSRIVFTASTTGTYYLDVGAWNDNYTGTYKLNVDVYTPPPVASYVTIAQHLTHGFWGGDSHHFNAAQGGTISVNLTALTPAGQNLAREALGLWSDIIGITFSEVAAGGQIQFDDDEAGAHAEGVWSNGITSSAHVNISTQWLSDYGTSLNSYGFQTYIHEIGHALGLGHAGFYNGSADYATDAVFTNDGWPATIMSYFDQDESLYFNDLGFSRAYLATPMLADIRGMATLYGLSTITRTGDTTYGFGNNSGRSVYTASVGSTIAALTIFDSGGIDTLNYSGFSSSQVINLTAETFSNVGGGIGNLAIAFGTLIENAVGGSGNDVIRGNVSSNILTGGGGNDSLDGMGGNDTLTGGSGVDLFTGGAGDDSFRDTRAGLSGDTITDFAAGDKIVFTDATLPGFTFSLTGNTLSYTGGSLILTGGVPGSLVATAAVGGGVQLAIQAQQPATINGTAGDDTLNGTSASETLNGLDGNDTINGAAGNDILNGGAGNDRLDGGAGNDTLTGGLGNDVFVVDSVSDVVTEQLGEGTDEVQTTLNSHSLAGNVEILRYLGSGNFTGIGGTGGDSLFGNIGADTLNGAAGNDILNGGGGNDTLIGGAGNDTLTGGAGDDSFRDAAAGLSGDTITDFAAGDKIVFTDSTLTGFTFNLTGNTLTYTGGSLTLTGGVPGSLVATAAVGGGVQLAIQAQQPATIDGTAGDDTLTGTSASETLNGLDGNDTIDGAAGNDILNGGAGNDTLIGRVGVDILTGDAGNDSFRGTKAGLSGDTITDFAAGDKIVFTDATLGSADPTSAGFTFRLTGNILTYTGGSLTLTGGVTGTLVATAAVGGGVQLAVQAQQPATINGTAGDDTLNGTSASETLNGLDGNDTINGAAGNDILNGGAGNDTLSGGGGTDSLTGGAGDDSFRDTAAGLSGDTITDFAAGDKIVFTDSTLAGFTFSLAGNTLTYTGGSLTLTGGVTGSLVATAAVGGGVQLAIQALQPATINGTAGDDTLNGTSASETLNGLGGNDTLSGGGGTDSLTGGAGDDSFRDTAAGLSGDTITDFAAGDKIVFTDATLAGFTFSLTGNTLTYTGGSLTLAGGVTGSLVATAAVGGGVQLAIQALQPATIDGTAGDDTLNGTSASETLNGLDGNDTINGAAGNDILNGGAGNDTLIGGVGVDTLTGDTGNDSFRGTRASLSGDTITDFAVGDKIVFTDATLGSADPGSAGFTFNLTGNTLTYTGGSLTLTGGVTGSLVATAAVGGGVQLTVQAPPAANNGTDDDKLTGALASDTNNNSVGDDSFINYGAADSGVTGQATTFTEIAGLIPTSESANSAGKWFVEAEAHADGYGMADLGIHGMTNCHVLTGWDFI